MNAAFVCTVILATCWLAVGGTTWASSIWVEVGDAGDVTDPQITQGVGSLTEIDGTIKALGDTIEDDAFLFGYGGAHGALHITFAFYDRLLLPVSTALFDEHGGFVAEENDGAVTLNDLPAGLHIVEAHSDQGLDPPYTITLDGPTLGPEGVLFASNVPEPDTLALSAGGLILLAARRLGSV